MAWFGHPYGMQFDKPGFSASKLAGTFRTSLAGRGNDRHRGSAFQLRTISYALLAAFLVATALGQTGPRTIPSHTSESFRGVSAVTQKIAWVSGTHGSYLRTIDGEIWDFAQVPDANNLDFRGVVAFSADEAFLMSSGLGDQSRIYHTSDAGKHWQLQFTGSNPKTFFDSIAFWDNKHGVVLGDPVADSSGKLRSQLFMTEDGQSWKAIATANLPVAVEGEGSFAASNTCIAILPSKPDVWFATGGKVARVFHSPDRGQTWQVHDAPIIHGPDSAGIFSIAFRDAEHGVIAGGDYKHPDQDGPNLAFTEDGGKTWTLSKLHPQAFFSAAAYDKKTGNGEVRLYLVGQDFVFDFRSPAGPTRLSPKKNSDTKFNAISPFPEGGALLAGPKGTIAVVP